MEGINPSYINPFSQKAPRSHIKALLTEDTNLSYINLFSQKAQILHIKALLMEGNTIHKFTTTKRALSRGKLIQVHDKKCKLNQPLHIARHTLSPFSCTHFFPSILKLSWQTASLPLKSFCRDFVYSLMLHHWGCKPLEISDSTSISLNLHN